MYPRNAASPEPIAIGAVVQISDGAVQTSGVTVRIKPVGVAEGDGAGTTSYSTNGVVYYTPTQAETNYTSFILIAAKTGCFPASQTVITTASATAGYAGLDWSKVTAPTTSLNLSGTTISTSQAVASVTSAVTVGTINANVITASALATSAVDEIVDAVWDELASSHNVAGSFGVLLKDAGADITEMLPLVQVLHDDWLNGGRLDLLLDGIKLWTDRLGTAMELDGLVYRFTTNALEQAPAGGGGGGTDWNADERTAIRSILGIPSSGTTPADPTVGILDTIRDAVGSGGSGISLPFAGAVADRVEGTKLQAFFNENTPLSIAVVDSSGNAVTVTGRTLRVSIEDKKGVDKLIIADGAITKSGSTVTFTVTTAVTATPTSYYWSLRDITSGNVVLLQGVLDVVYAAEADA